MKTKLEKFLTFFSVATFLIGTIGYLKAGEEISDSMYACFALFFTNPVYDDYNILIEIAAGVQVW